MIDVKFWLKVLQGLRDDGSYPHADELREMLRRMGWELKQGKKEVEAIKID